MAEKRGARIDDTLTSKSERNENPADYLGRVGVTRQIQEVLTILLDNEPDNPIAFIAKYFANAAEHVSSVSQAYQYLCLSHHSQVSYQNNLLKAYKLLNRQSIGHGLKGLTGKKYNELLSLICRDSITKETASLLQLLQKREQNIVNFNMFNSGVTCCFIFQDFILEAKSLFDELALSEKDQADYSLCKAMLTQLETSVSKGKESSTLCILEAGLFLSKQNISIEINKTLNESVSGEIMTLDEFVHEACMIFLSKISVKV
ncbi:tubulin polyglutamylase complex subunit 1-like [Xenia sp. Carnegie-2017]|uniref:tubulin polyglutamylase complex subunit 1-like n=1 Tax=Xenia sp. Carnegie-2017 TaxID=2897299 RepID=UPI001F04F215|nr:tubulin polyglutamylase complex subunit 1-like [Xenia sp. Carnegie-2017]